MSSRIKSSCITWCFRAPWGASCRARARQLFEIDIELGLDLSRAMTSDALTDTVDYSRLHAIVREEVEGSPISAHRSSGGGDGATPHG
jgi:hypothetical protein